MASDKKRKAESKRLTKIKVSKVQDDQKVFLSDVGHLSIPKDAKFSTATTNGETSIKGKSTRMRYTSVPVDHEEYCVAVISSKGSADLIAAESIELKAMSKQLAKRVAENAEQKTYREQKINLGNEFGTLKAKKTLASQARNNIDSNELVDFEDDVVDVVASATANLPTHEQVTEAMDGARPIPLHNLETLDVNEIYPVHGYLTDEEAGYIQAEAILEEQDIQKRMEQLPYKTSQMVRDSLYRITDTTEETLYKTTLLYYLSLLIGFYRERHVKKREDIKGRLSNPPEYLIDQMLYRYTTPLSGGHKSQRYHTYMVNSKNEAMLLCTIIILVLRLNHNVVDIPVLSQEVGIKPSKLADVCRQVGCTIKTASLTHMDAIGRDRKEANNWKIASLKAPLKLPELAQRRRRAKK
ncbi:DNA-directed RNA polymerase I subunit RPA49 [Yarrowia sp. B02]|nr:DNA-directed RNA polymerase I subunit RPA49 [Yarrowia sp. B02]